MKRRTEGEGAGGDTGDLGFARGRVFDCVRWVRDLASVRMTGRNLDSIAEMATASTPLSGTTAIGYRCFTQEQLTCFTNSRTFMHLY